MAAQLRDLASAASSPRRACRCSPSPQTDVRMIPASAGLHRAVLERGLLVPADPSCASTRPTRR
jgi:hypothetical protein